MKSKIAEAIHLTYNPVAIVWSDEKPADALHFDKEKSGWQGCTLWFYADAMNGKTAVFDWDTIGCANGFTSLGFGNQLLKNDYSLECLYYFMSTGNEKWEEGKKAAKELEKKGYPDYFVKAFLAGEAMKKNPEIAEQSLKNWNIISVNTKYVLFKPLKEADPDKEKIAVISFPVNIFQLSALTALANFDNPENNGVICPAIDGACQAIGMYPYKEMDAENPRAVIGLKELSPLENKIGDNLVTFSVPLKLFYKMENNVDDSFLKRNTWQKIVEKKKEHWEKM